MKRAITAALLLPALMLGLLLPVSALFGSREEKAVVGEVSKSGLAGGTVTFSADDFKVRGGKRLSLTALVVESLPDPGMGTLLLGGTVLEQGARVEKTALSGLRFLSVGNPTANRTEFALRPTFSNGEEGEPFTVAITLTDKTNHPPVARNMELNTYKNVSVTGYFDAVDGEGDTLTFRMTSTPARGAVTMAEDGSGQFVYRPYENKTGKDTFTYVAVDEAGNTSAEATVSLRIQKGNTAVTYADLDGHPAHKSAVRLAEEGIYVGAEVAGVHLFDAGRPVTRAEFLSMAMAVAELEPLKGVTVTGFSDDEVIPDWSRGCVSAAVMAGAVQGGRDETGAVVFAPNDVVTAAQAAVMLDGLLGITDVPLEVFAGQSKDHWAAQAAANLASGGVIRPEGLMADSLAQPMTLGEVAVMLDGAMEIMDMR